MYYVVKRLEIAGAHSVKMDHQTKCEELHGHNWIVYVHCRAKELNDDGMVTDFTEIKKLIHNKIDHKNLNEVLPFNPTAENIAKWISEQIEHCYKVEIWESENNKAIYEVDE